MSEERRANPNPLDVAGALASLYTLGYLGMVACLFFIQIPDANREPLLQLFGLMSAIQMALISFYFGSSKSGEATQRAIQQRQGRSEAVIQEIAKAVPTLPLAPGAAAPSKVDAVNIESEQTTVTTGDSKP